MVVDKKYKLKDIQEYLPLVCMEEPAPNSAFCEVHSHIVQKFGHPIKVRDFIRSCQVDPTHYNTEGRKKVSTRDRYERPHAPSPPTPRAQMLVFGRFERMPDGERQTWAARSHQVSS